MRPTERALSREVCKDVAGVGLEVWAGERPLPSLRGQSRALDK